MTYEEFRQIACNRPHPDTPGFYKLEWFVCENEKSYMPTSVDGGNIWSFKGRLVWGPKLYEYYPTFEAAHSAMMAKIGLPDVYSFRLSKLGYGPLGMNDFYIHFSLYDANGEEYLKSVCSSYHYNQSGLAGKFLGRDEETVRFSPGDIVQISRLDPDTMYLRETLGVVAGQPRSVDDFWESYQISVKENGECKADKEWFEEPSLCGSDDDEYFIQFGPYEPDMCNFMFCNSMEIKFPSFPVPDNILKELKAYYRAYQDYVESDED